MPDVETMIGAHATRKSAPNRPERRLEYPDPRHFGARCYAHFMAADDKGGKNTGMKSAYELALERLERQGIERPREESFSDELRAGIAEARRQAEAKLAEIEI